MDRRDHRAYANSSVRSILRACASPRPPTRTELTAELSSEGIPEQFHADILRGAELVAQAANTGKIGSRRIDAQRLADTLSLQLHRQLVKAESLTDVAHHDDEADDVDPSNVDRHPTGRVTASTTRGVSD